MERKSNISESETFGQERGPVAAIDSNPATAAPQFTSSPLFTRLETVFLAGLILAGTLLRWLNLDERPYHHDESLHGMYGRYFYDFPDHNFYRYDPMLHGPLLYNLLRIVYSTVGYSDWGARSVIALLGTISLFLPLIFRRYLTKELVIAMTAFIALSPTLIYWSRFLREDPLVLTGWFLMLYGVLLANPKRKALFFLLGLSIHFCAKENSFVTLAILLGFLIYESLVALVFRYPESKTLVMRLWENITKYPGHLLLGFAVAAFFYIYLYSAGFRHMEGILDGLYRKSIVYWYEHHGMERIKGPFLFHFYVLSWYELPFVAAFLGQIYLFYRRATIGYLFVAAFTLVIMTLALMMREDWVVKALIEFTKSKDGLDLAAVFIFLVHPVLVTTYHLARGQRGMGFFAYLFLATMFTYSYLGEKVPWLSIYPLVTGIVYLALFYKDYFERYPIKDYREIDLSKGITWVGSFILILGILFTLQEAYLPSNSWESFFSGISEAARVNSTFLAAGISIVLLGLIGQHLEWLPTFNLKWALLIIVCVWNFRAALLTNFVFPGHAREYLSQVHTTPEFHRLMYKFRDEVEVQHRGFKPLIYIAGDATWPSTWYLRDIPEYKFNMGDLKLDDFTYIVQNWKEPPENIPPGYKVVRVNLRGWWVPDFANMTLRGFLNYSLNHTPWSTVGYQYVHLLVKE